jgi:DNA-binding LacI/PurR family transcriptional regulator
MLLSRLNDTAAQTVRRKVVLPTHLTVRESTGPV